MLWKALYKSPIIIIIIIMVVTLPHWGVMSVWRSGDAFRGDSIVVVVVIVINIISSS